MFLCISVVLFVSEQCSEQQLAIHLPVDGHLGCFQFLAS